MFTFVAQQQVKGCRKDPRGAEVTSWRFSDVWKIDVWAHTICIYHMIRHGFFFPLPLETIKMATCHPFKRLYSALIFLKEHIHQPMDISNIITGEHFWDIVIEYCWDSVVCL